MHAELTYEKTKIYSLHSRYFSIYSNRQCSKQQMPTLPIIDPTRAKQMTESKWTAGKSRFHHTIY